MPGDFDLEDIPASELLEEIQKRLDAAHARELQLEKVREILNVSAQIAFGDYSEMHRLKLLFNDAGVYSPGLAQLEIILGDG